MQPSKEEIRRRIARRKKERPRNGSGSRDATQAPLPGWLQDEEKYGFNDLISYESGPGEGGHPLFNKELFFFKLLAASLLFLAVAIVFRSQSPAVAPVKELVEKNFSQDFQFAAVSDWYEGKFGKPLAILPVPEKEKPVQAEFAMPASGGKILENFEKNGQGVMIQTEKDAPVEAINGGLVIFASVKEGLGKTVIVQHGDKSESWYGNLDSIEVKLYDHVKKEKELGRVGPGSDDSKGEFYFAIKKKDGFIDPIQVISFE